jgi:hypothetical protein
VVATVGNCKSAAATTNVVIKPTPAAPVVANNGPLCAGDSLKLTASTIGGATYSWTGPNNFNIQNPVKANVATTDSGVYTVIATLSGCNSTAATTDVAIYNTPATPVAGNNGPLCIGASLQLTSSNVTGASYNWTGPNNFNSQNPTKANVTFSDSGSYTVVAVIGGCTSGPATTHVVITPGPAAPTVGNSGPVCVGASLHLTASTIGGASYSWTGPNSFNVQNPSIANASLADSGTYTVVVTVAGCSSLPVTTHVVVTPGPAAPTISNNGPLCTGDNLQLTASSVNGATYSWTGPNNFNIENPSKANVTLSDAGSYTLVITVAGCNSLPVSTTVVINSTPSPPTVSNSGPVCANAALQFTATGANGATYSWTGPNNFSQQNPSISNVSASDSGVYSVTQTVNGCTSNAATTDVVVIPLPGTPTASSNSPLCAGDSLHLTAATVAGASYSWSGPNNFNVQNPSKGNTVLADSGTYTVVATLNGCTSQSSTLVVINAVPGAFTITESDSVMCAGDSVQICVPNTYSNYAWNNGKTGQCIYVNAAGNYYVTVTNASGCSAESSNHVSVAVHQVPAVSITESGDTLDAVNANSVQWYLNGNAISGATSNVYVATVTGAYSVQVTDTNGCKANSTPVNITVLGMPGLSNDAVFNIYPNPASDKLIIDLKGLPISVPVEIYDAQGKLVMEFRSQNVISTLPVAGLAAGTYMIKVQNTVRKFCKN